MAFIRLWAWIMGAWSIRTHLLLLVVAVSAPLGALLAYGIYHDMQQSVAYAKYSLRTLANTMVSNTGNKIANARDLMERLAQRPLIQQTDPTHCDPILQEVQSLKLGYANLGYTDLQGRLLCTAILSANPEKPVLFGNAPWFRTLLSDKRFTIGNPAIGPVSGKWISILSTPIWNAQHEMVGAVLLGLDLKAFDPHIPAQFLPPESRYGFFAEDGVMIWRNLDPEGVIGTRPNAEAARRIVEMKDGEFESLAVDGVVRFFSVVPMPETRWIAFVGVPVSSVYALAKQRAIMAAAMALAALVLLALIATLIARRIGRPVAQLERTARAIQGANFGVRAPETGPHEVAEVARAFNTMVQALERGDAQLRSMAFYDALTQLPNRRLLNDRLAQAMAASKRSGCYAALMFLDLDNFKPLNDAYGHEVGDLLLIEVAHRLKTCVREVDTVARFGGDEFVVMLCELDLDQSQSTAQAMATAEKIRLILAKTYVLRVHHEGNTDTTVEHHCSASIGVTLFRNHDFSPQEVIKSADQAMYQAKQSGRNVVCFLPSPEIPL